MALTREDLQAIGELMREEIAPLRADMDEMRTDMDEIKERVTKIQVIQENMVLPRIQLLAEGHSGLVDRLERLDELPEQVEDIQSTVSVLKHVFKEFTHN